MPYRNLEHVNQSTDSLAKVNSKRPKHILLGGDFNCPDINWDRNITTEQCPERNMQESLIDIANTHSLSQFHRNTTREDRLLDLTFTSNPTLTIIDFDIRPQYVKQFKRKVYQYNIAKWDAIARNLEDTSEKLTSNETLTVYKKWILFKSEINFS